MHDSNCHATGSSQLFTLPAEWKKQAYHHFKAMVKLLNVLSRDIIKPMKAALPAATAVCCCIQLL